MVVEDDDVVRELTARQLRKFGYTVLTAEDGHAALRLLETHAGVVDLVITDIVMPGMSGATLATALAAIAPATKVLYVSGYLERTGGPQDLVSPSAPFLHKPFTADELAAKIREVLAAGAGTEPG